MTLLIRLHFFFEELLQQWDAEKTTHGSPFGTGGGMGGREVTSHDGHTPCCRRYTFRSVVIRRGISCEND